MHNLSTTVERTLAARSISRTIPRPALGWPEGWQEGWQDGWQTTRPFVLAVAVFVLGSYASAAVLVLGGRQPVWRGPVGLGAYTFTATTFFAFQSVVWMIQQLWVRRVAAPAADGAWGWERWRAAAREFRRDEVTPGRLTGAVLVCALFPLLLATFTGWKVVIPDWRAGASAFPWDATLSSLDRTLHGGVDPWRWLQPLVGTPWVTWLLGNAYGPAWMAVLTGSVFVAAWDRDVARRRQMLVASVLLWGVVGSLVSTVFASAGPCFAPLASGDDRYGPLLVYLRTMHAAFPIPVLEAQRFLWETYRTVGSGATTAGAGISAMPSLHVGAATLVACYGWRRSRVCGLWLTAFVVVTMVGSVHLAFHYAVDGYVAALSAIGCWVGAGRWTAGRPSRQRA